MGEADHRQRRAVDNPPPGAITGCWFGYSVARFPLALQINGPFRLSI
jgi:hypothetical protein